MDKTLRFLCGKMLQNGKEAREGAIIGEKQQALRFTTLAHTATLNRGTYTDLGL